MGLVEANVRPLFFVSYAHDFGEDDEHVRRFHNDLSHDVRLHSGLRGDDLGFCDTSLRAGDLWSPALVDALRRCQVLLALCSPTYFNRPSCGKEWSLFERRLAEMPKGRRGATSSLLPLFWVPMEMPAVAAPYQYRDRALGSLYGQRGLRDLIRQSRHRDQYRDFVSALAVRVIDLAGRVRVPPYRRRPEFDEVEAAFPEAAPTPAVHRQRRPPPGPPPGISTAGIPGPRFAAIPRLNPQDPPPPRDRRREPGRGTADGTDGSRGRGVMEGDPL
ncbi:MAG TPA: TIR-like protein FxsC [Micromonosporaceae bacterium]|nr:TIR-like protein FxsC [Micromonosporaceae bacterium]